MTNILAACEKYGMKCRGGKYRGPENARRFEPLYCYSGTLAYGLAMLSSWNEAASPATSCFSTRRKQAHPYMFHSLSLC